MNFPSTTEEILSLPLSIRETSTRSRKLNGGHLFISRWHHSFKALNFEEKKKIRDLLMLSSSDVISDTDDISIDSTDSRFNQPVTSYEKMKMAWMSWRNLDELIKGAWNVRARSLNTRPIPGILKEPPNNWSMVSFASNVFNSMAMEWRQVVGLFRRAILYPRLGNADSITKSYMFGDEQVTVGNKCFRSFRLSQLLILTIFGSGFTKVPSDCVIKVTKTIGILHIDSMHRMKSMFSLANESAVSFNHHNDCNGLERMQSCCGKVRVELRGKCISGYIISESEDGSKWIIHLLNNKKVILDKVLYSHRDKCYVYNLLENEEGYKITSYEPIRLSISLGRVYSKFTLNTVCFDSSNNIIDNYSH